MAAQSVWNWPKRSRFTSGLQPQGSLGFFVSSWLCTTVVVSTLKNTTVLPIYSKVRNTRTHTFYYHPLWPHLLIQWCSENPHWAHSAHRAKIITLKIISSDIIPTRPVNVLILWWLTVILHPRDPPPQPPSQSSHKRLDSPSLGEVARQVPGLRLFDALDSRAPKVKPMYTRHFIFLSGIRPPCYNVNVNSGWIFSSGFLA